MTLKDSLQTFLNSKKLDAHVERVDINEPIIKFWVKLGSKGTVSRLERNSIEMGLVLRSNPPIIVPEVSEGSVRLEFFTGEHPIISFDELAERVDFATSEEISGKYELPVLLGTTDVKTPLIVDLCDFPHILLAGTTGSGKSICMHNIIQSLRLRAEKHRIKLVLLDPKFVEFSKYENDSSLYYVNPGVATTPEMIEERLNDLTKEMDQRLKSLKRWGCRDLREYRAKRPGRGSYIVVVIDELADLMRTTNKRFERSIDRLAAKSRAAGIHIVSATQYPHTNVITSTIKANFDGRICFRVTDPVYSRVMLASGDAAKLQGKGDALISGGPFHMQRFRSAITTFEEKEISLVRKVSNLFYKKIS